MKVDISSLLPSGGSYFEAQGRVWAAYFAERKAKGASSMRDRDKALADLRHDFKECLEGDHHERT